MLVLYVLAASILFYFGVAIVSLTPGGYHESWFEAALPLLIFMFPALLITGRIAWLLSKARPLWLTVPISIGVVAIGAVLISLAIWRENWVALFWRR